MNYLTQKELKKMMLLSWQRIEEDKEEINRINVFPVPDQDTGSNMAKTLLGIKEAIEDKNFKNLKEVSEAALDGALTTAQGNAGVIYTGFLAGFLPSLYKEPIGAKKLAEAFKKGGERARLSIQDPKEGTILDVIDAAADIIKRKASEEKNLITILKIAAEKANEALLATREKMEIFRKANVVDAGGLAFLIILESYRDALGDIEVKGKEKERPSVKTRRFIQTISTRYEVVSLIENLGFTEKEIKEKLKRWGNSLDIVCVGKKIKVHIHTDFIDEVKEIMRQSGRVLSLRVEDMAKEVVGEESLKKTSIGIVTDEVAGIISKIINRYQIEVVPIILNWPEGEKLAGKNIYQKMRTADALGTKTFPKTSQPIPKSYLSAFKKQLQKFDKILCITITSKLSGCYNSAIQAKEMLKNNKRIFIFDSLHATASQALLILRAIELIQEQREITDIINELRKLIPETHLYFTFEDPKWMEAGGRITEGKANWIRVMKKIRLHPIIEMKKGTLVRSGIILAKDDTEALFQKISRASYRTRQRGKRIRTIIAHADALEKAMKLKKMIKRINGEVSFINLASPVMGAHVGPGALVVAWMTT